MSARLKPGEVRDAIVAFLKTQRDGAKSSEISKAVDRAFGRSVAKSSVRSYLNLNTGHADAIFERTGRGVYRLRKS